jgi:hypothetical protein
MELHLEPIKQSLEQQILMELTLYWIIYSITIY